jgi:hypothetical protein
MKTSEIRRLLKFGLGEKVKVTKEKVIIFSGINDVEEINFLKEFCRPYVNGGFTLKFIKN